MAHEWDRGLRLGPPLPASLAGKKVRVGLKSQQPSSPALPSQPRVASTLGSGCSPRVQSYIRPFGHLISIIFFFFNFFFLNLNFFFFSFF